MSSGRGSGGTGTEVAVVGMAGRFPGAGSVDELWENLCRGVESIRRLSPEEVAARVAPETAAAPGFVPVEALPDGFELFDADLFGMSQREAEITDPQHRLLLECAWEALEDAGYDPTRFDGPIGVFAGATVPTYLPFHLLPHRDLVSSLAPVQLNIGNAADFLTTRVSYKLDLKGPSHAVQCACSTSLVAVHLACQKLLEEECDAALAGGVSINLTLRGGYRHLEGGMASPDGHCRPFDASAQGTVFGGGAGIVVLRRLADALADGDAIHAVILGSAVNNDGAFKVGYTAPSVEGQAEVVSEALANAGVEPETVGYVEAHGTATPLGDPIEVRALNKAFRSRTSRGGFCSVGSIKGNIGHLDAAAGVAGLIKTVLSLEREAIPPTLHFASPNPELPLEDSPFRVVAELTPWPRGEKPRRAGVSAFGVGGTNAHVILEEPPPRPPLEEGEASRLLLLSAHTPTALAAAASRLRRALSAPRPPALPDVAFTLAVGRRALEHRAFVVAEHHAEAVSALAGLEGSSATRPVKGELEVAFLFPGQGSQQAGMGEGIYRSEPTFRRELDRCCEILAPELGIDLRRAIFDAAADLDRTELAQPALFAVEWALARLWQARGLRPTAMLGHSLGEYVAACLAGVFQLEDALRLVAERGRRMGELPGGAMTALPLAEEEAVAWLDRLDGELALAAVNASQGVVVAGPEAAMEELEAKLAEQGVRTRRLRTSHAFHSPMVAPLREGFVARVAEVVRSAPSIPFVSNVTGTWIEATRATDPEYWGDHLCRPVRFADGLDTLLAGPRRALLEVGPGRALSQLARRHSALAAGHSAVASMPRSGEAGADIRALAVAAGHLFSLGAPLDTAALFVGERRRVRLPTYPFERDRCWIEPPSPSPMTGAGTGSDTAVPEEAPPAAVPVSPLAGGRPRPQLEVPYTPPATPLEQRVAAVWQETLGLADVGVHDNFFDLGGDSLVAVQTIERLKRALEREIPVASLYEGITVRALAEVLSAPAAAPPAATESRRQRAGSRRRYQEQRRDRRRGQTTES